MKNNHLSPVIFFLLLMFAGWQVDAQVHTTYLWHMQQPNYWPDQSVWNTYGYQTVRESQSLKMSGGNYYSDGQNHPLNDLENIFNKPDRVAAYQYRPKESVQTLLGHSEAGAQVNYSGCLIENVNSLASASQWGYYGTWANEFKTARSWTTSGGKPRLDLTGFTFHHALSPLLSEKCLKKQIQAHKEIYNNTFNNSPTYSKGYWPAECSFSERIIKVLVEEGFEWSIIANSHLARTLSDYPLNYGTSGCNIDPPNRADVVSTTGNNWWSGQIDGRGGSFAAPYCYQAHKAKYVDPATGTEYKIDVVPMADLLSYQNGFSTMGTGDIDANIAPYNNNSQPCLVLMAHDGDNAWGGGYDYYMNSVPGLANAAAGQGYVPSTIQQFLTDHPVPASDVVHVEDGSWFNAANDWGHPQFINWLWPMYTSGHTFDPNGWTEDARNWAVLVAAENRVQMAEDLSGGTNINKIVYPSSTSSNAELAWHHLLPGFTSGYMYYGTSLDMEVKQTLACNIATDYADIVINGSPGTDNTPPNVFIPQRFPYNPGGTGFGPITGYQQVTYASDFHVWTFAYDASGMASVTLKYRTDYDGENPIGNNENETYSGGSGVTAWQSLSMTSRPFPTGNITGNPDVNFFILPDYMADEYYAQITGLADTLVDYYVEAIDNQGNVFKTPIQHVYVGASNAGGGSGNPNITWSPTYPTQNDVITITVNNATQAGKLHWGVNNWSQPINNYWPTGSLLFGGSGPAIQSPMNFGSNQLTLDVGPFNDAGQSVSVIDFVINYNDGSWDNNNGADYHIPITFVGQQPQAQFGVTISPNPASDRARIHIQNGVDPLYRIEVLDLSGKKVMLTHIPHGSSELGVSGLSDGIYLVRITGTETLGSVDRKLLVRK